MANLAETGGTIRAVACEMCRVRGRSASCWQIVARLRGTDALVWPLSESSLREAHRQECLSHSLHRVVEEDDVRRTPHGGGDGAAGLAGHHNFEKLGRGGEVRP